MKPPHPFQQLHNKLITMFGCIVEAVGYFLPSFPLTPTFGEGKDVKASSVYYVEHHPCLSLCFMSGICLIQFLQRKHCQRENPCLLSRGLEREWQCRVGAGPRAQVFLIQTFRQVFSFQCLGLISNRHFEFWSFPGFASQSRISPQVPPPYHFRHWIWPFSSQLSDSQFSCLPLPFWLRAIDDLIFIKNIWHSLFPIFLVLR